VLLTQPSRLKFIKIEPHCCRIQQNYFSKLCSFDIIQKMKIPWPLSESSASYHSNIFTFTVLLSEGRTGEAWESSNKTTLFLSTPNKVYFNFPMNFHFHPTLLLYIYIYISVSRTSQSTSTGKPSLTGAFEHGNSRGIPHCWKPLPRNEYMKTWRTGKTWNML
jgi:hypothetical protein